MVITIMIKSIDPKPPRFFCLERWEKNVCRCVYRKRQAVRESHTHTHTHTHTEEREKRERNLRAYKKCYWKLLWGPQTTEGWVLAPQRM